MATTVIWLYHAPESIGRNDIRLTDPTVIRGVVGTVTYVEALRPATLFPGSGPNPMARLRPNQGGERFEVVIPPVAGPTLNQVIIIGKGWYLPITDGRQVRLTRDAGWSLKP